MFLEFASVYVFELFNSSRKKFTSFPAILLENFQNLFIVPNSIWLDQTPSTHFSSSCERTQQRLKESHFLHDFLHESGL
jgi:alpha-N-acetylglucosamine transferase